MFSAEQVVFLILAGLACLAAIGVVGFASPIRSAMCLVVNFFLLAFIYFGLRAQLLGITQILVYTGAIMVLFLFVVMLLNLGGAAPKSDKYDWKVIPAVLFGAGLLALIASQVMVPLKEVPLVQAPDEYGLPQPIGKVLFSQYVWPFEVASLLLLVGIVGSILLAKRKI